MQRVPITKEGYEKLKAELQRLQKEERPAVIKAIERRWKNQGAFTARIVPTPLTDAEAENASVWNGEANVRQR